jgi:hypothetical protein
MKDDTNWLQTKDVPPNHRHHCSKSQQQCHPQARAMNPQGRFQSVTWVPKLVSSQALKLSISHRFPNTYNNPSTQLSSTKSVPPERMDLHPSLPHSPSGSPSPSCQGLQHRWSRISMLELSGLVVVCKSRHMPIHFRHAGPKSCLDHTSDHYNQLSCG